MRVVSLLAVALAVSTACAEEQLQVPKSIVKELQSLAGTWKVEGRVGDEKTEGTWSAYWAPGKHCLVRRSSISIEDQTMIGIGVIGWDAATERITEQVFLSNNGSVLLRWKVLPSGNWEGAVSGFQQGKKVESKAMLTKKGPDEIHYEETSADGKTSEAVLRRVPRKERERVKTGVPKAALEAMKYRVGKWESIAYVDGKEVEERGSEVTKWIPGRYAISIQSSFVEDGVKIHASGIVGWDVEKKQLVEHWYTSDGGYATFRYDLDKKTDAWVGICTWVYGDGRRIDGESVVEKKSENEWEWNASSTSDGTKRTWKNINRRVATAETIGAGDEKEELRTSELTAEDYVEFMSPLVGSWKSTGEEGGKTSTGTWTYQLAPNKKCFLMNSTNESGAESQTVDGYNSVTKKYTVAGFDANDNFLFLTMDLPAVKKGRRLGKGVLGTWKFKTSSRDGKTTTATSTFTCEEIREDRVVFVFTDCREDGKRMPDARWTLERTVQKKE